MSLGHAIYDQILSWQTDLMVSHDAHRCPKRLLSIHLRDTELVAMMKRSLNICIAVRDLVSKAVEKIGN
jgi:hypothetical protein